MVNKEEYLDKLSAQLKDWRIQIDSLKNKAAKGTAEIKIAIEKEIVVLNKMMKEAQIKLKDLEGKTGDAWKVFAEGANKAWGELREAMRRAGEKFK